MEIGSLSKIVSYNSLYHRLKWILFLKSHSLSHSFVRVNPCKKIPTLFLSLSCRSLNQIGQWCNPGFIDLMEGACFLPQPPGTYFNVGVGPIGPDWHFIGLGVRELCEL